MTAKEEKTEAFDPSRDEDHSGSDQVYLLVMGPGVTRMVGIRPGKQALMGRGEDCDISVQDKKLYRQHALFKRVENQLFVTDLDSTNGTYVNGEKLLTGRRLDHGDEIKAGSTRAVAVLTSARAVPGRAPAAEGKGAETPSPVHGRGDIVVADPTMLKIYELCDRIAPKYSSALIMGETGVGKEVVARYLHSSSPYRDGPFIAINCAAVPENIAESELFGYEKGAFTGAESRKAGHLEAAHRGTLFLDEISDLAQSMQAKLLRFLDSGALTRLGGTEPVHVDTRIIGASNKDMDMEVRDGKMRADFFFRLNQFVIYLPPLRSRPSEIIPLARHFLALMSAKHGAALRFSPEAEKRLAGCDWPGNARQLRHVVERAAILAEGDVIDEGLIASTIDGSGQDAAPAPGMDSDVEDVEKRSIVDALRSSGGNVTKAAKMLGITRRRLGYKIKKYGILKP
jgi:DNA-binding NtrC family response regulator